jgi:hypothetical protein
MGRYVCVTSVMSSRSADSIMGNLSICFRIGSRIFASENLICHAVCVSSEKPEGKNLLTHASTNEKNLVTHASTNAWINFGLNDSTRQRQRWRRLGIVHLPSSRFGLAMLLRLVLSVSNRGQGLSAVRRCSGGFCSLLRICM